MTKIRSATRIAPDIYEFVVEHPGIAQKAQAGHFVALMVDEKGERIPLTIADWDADQGTVTLIVMVVGTTTAKLAQLQAGDRLYALVGPLGRPSDIVKYGTVVMVAGGVGTAPIYPIARELQRKGNRIITIQGSRSRNLLFWQDKLKSVSHTYILTTDDGSAGQKGLVTEPLQELLQNMAIDPIHCVYAIGPAIMMKYCSRVTHPYNVKTLVSLNSLMIDATGMCGVCRVNIGGCTKFTCVDGPEFDGHQVDWTLLMDRQKTYRTEEKISWDRYRNKEEQV